MFLLDINVWLWALQAPSRLNLRVRKELSNSANELWLSPVLDLGSVAAQRQGQDSAPGESGRVAGASHRASAGSSFHPRDRARRNCSCPTAILLTGFSLLRFRSWI